MSLKEAKVATYRKRCGKWQAIIRHKNIGTQARTFVQKSTAIKWALEQEKRLDNGTFGKILPSEITLRQLLTRYAQEITPKKRGAAAEQRRLKRLIRDRVSDFKLAQLTNMTLANFRDRRLSDGKRACQYDIVLIRHCIKIARNEWGLQLDTNPADNISLPPSGKPRARRLLDSEWEQLQEARNLTKNPHIWPVICFALHSGMRRGEILSLQWANTNFEKKLAYLPLTKNGADREVPLTPEALGVLYNQLGSGYERPFPISENAFRLAWTRLKHRSGIKDFKFHDFRHEAISRFFELGLSPPEVALISGHKDPRMLFRYTHLKAVELSEKLQHLT